MSEREKRLADALLGGKVSLALDGYGGWTVRIDIGKYQEAQHLFDMLCGLVDDACVRN